MSGINRYTEGIVEGLSAEAIKITDVIKTQLINWFVY